ncbi:MAG: hypothetical protein HYT76_06425 [Deltaproteobacteria bacterium]|nr:hypothetical protein [Deltaproteobacteria bacterium]
MKPVAYFFGLFVVTLTPVLFAQVVEAPVEYSADVFQVQKGKPYGEGKIWVGKKGAKIDLVTKGVQSVQLHQFDKKIFWIEVGMPEGSLPLYMEKKAKFFPLIHQNWWGFTENCVDDGEFDGHPVKKCQTKGEYLGKKEEATIWRAQDLNGTVIRYLDKKGKNEMHVKNIQVAAQPPELFATPEGASENPEGETGEVKKSLGGLKDLFK